MEILPPENKGWDESSPEEILANMNNVLNRIQEGHTQPRHITIMPSGEPIDFGTRCVMGMEPLLSEVEPFRPKQECTALVLRFDHDGSWCRDDDPYLDWLQMMLDFAMFREIEDSYNEWPEE